MCGIAGALGALVGRDGSIVSGVERMRESQTHRGPDDCGWLVRDGAVFAHNRLSIIDLSACGHQPMSNETGTVWVCFNGEVYNHRELREQLERAGHRFASTSDTEALVHGYEEWGIGGLVERLRGMFAFAVYDARREGEGAPATFYLVRDRFGIKPLYYAHLGDGRVAFASEVRALATSGLVPPDEDPAGWLGFLMFGSVPTPHTTLRAVRALPPGHLLSGVGGAARLSRYYDVADHFLAGEVAEGGDGGSDPSAAFRGQLRGVLEETTELHLISDAPIGVFLSGGIDSSALVALAASRHLDLRTVAIVFEESAYSEDRWQTIVAERYRTNHHRVMVRAADARARFGQFLDAMDQPTVDGLNTYFVADSARRAGLKAVLAGVGGDEIFAGYSTLDRAPAIERLRRIPVAARRLAVRQLARIPSLRKLEFLRGGGVLPSYLVQRGLYTPGEAARLLGAPEEEAWRLIAALEPDRFPRDAVLRHQFLETRHYLVDQLLRDGDVFGMAHSLEIRVPFVDHVLAETVLRSPVAWRRDPHWPKQLLSRTLEDLLPRDVVFRPKKGFAFPIGEWLRSWDAGDVAGAGALDSAAVRGVWREFREGRVHWSRPWSLMVLSRGLSS